MKDKKHYLNLLEKFSDFLIRSKEPTHFTNMQFCELTKNTNKTYTVTICVAAFEELPLVYFGEHDEWYWDSNSGLVKLSTHNELDTVSAVLEYFSLHSDVFKHFFCLNSQLEKYGTKKQLTEQCSLSEIGYNIQTFIKKERSQQ